MSTPQMYHVDVVVAGRSERSYRTVVADSTANATAIAVERERARLELPTSVQLFAAATLVRPEIGSKVRVA